VGIAVTIFNLIIQGCFSSEKEPLEDANRFGPVGHHLGQECFQPGIVRQVHKASATACPKPRRRKVGSATILISPTCRDHPWPFAQEE
jgi:hypothetical protein